MMTQSDERSIALYPELAGLVALRDGAVWSFSPDVRDGTVFQVLGARLWPPDRWSEALVIRDRGDAKAVRCNPAGGEVWLREGTLLFVLNELHELPAPGQPAAPTLVRGAERLWTPEQWARA